MTWRSRLLLFLLLTNDVFKVIQIHGSGWNMRRVQDGNHSSNQGDGSTTEQWSINNPITKQHFNNDVTETQRSNVSEEPTTLQMTTNDDGATTIQRTTNDDATTAQRTASYTRITQKSNSLAGQHQLGEVDFSEKREERGEMTTMYYMSSTSKVWMQHSDKPRPQYKGSNVVTQNEEQYHEETTVTYTSNGLGDTALPLVTDPAPIQTVSNKPSCVVYRFVIYVLLFGLISLIGVVSNIVCLVVLWPDRKKSATTLFLLQLAVVDILVLLAWSVMLSVRQALRFFDWLGKDDYLARTDPYLQQSGWAVCNVIQMVSCWLIVVITIQRYVAVCHPHTMRQLSSTRHAWLQLTIISVVSFVFNLPRFLEYNVVPADDDIDGVLKRVSSSLGSRTSYQVVYKGAFFYLVMFVVPVCLLIYLTFALLRKLRKARTAVGVQFGNSSSAPSKSQPPKQQTSVTTADKSKKHTIIRVAPKPRTPPDSTAKLSVPKNLEASTSSTIVTSNAQTAASTSVSSGNTASGSSSSASQEDVTFALVIVDIVFILCQLLNPMRRIVELFLTAEQRQCGGLYSYMAPLSGLGIFINSSANFFIFCLCGRGFRKLVKQRLKGLKCYGHA